MRSSVKLLITEQKKTISAILKRIVDAVVESSNFVFELLFVKVGKSVIDCRSGANSCLFTYNVMCLLPNWKNLLMFQTSRGIAHEVLYF